MKKRRRMSKRIIRRIVVLGLCAAVCMISIAVLLKNYISDTRDANEFASLARRIDPAKTDIAAVTFDSVAQPEPAAAAKAPVAAQAPAKTTILPQYVSLCKENPDFYGWIQIEGTMIDYPVMWVPKEEDHYLHRAFNGRESLSGVPFIGSGFTEDSKNTMIYGHHMKNGTMFAGLMDYQVRDFWRQHPVVRFDTRYEEGVYDVFAVFRSKIADNGDTDTFRYYDYGNLMTQEAFDAFVAECRAISLYDTGIIPKWGDKLITLSTCAYHTTNGRFILVARKEAAPSDFS